MLGEKESQTGKIADALRGWNINSRNSEEDWTLKFISIGRAKKLWVEQYIILVNLGHVLGIFGCMNSSIC